MPRGREPLEQVLLGDSDDGKVLSQRDWVHATLADWVEGRSLD